MSQCLVVAREVLEDASFWTKVPGAILLNQAEISEFLEMVEKHGQFMERYGDQGIEEKPEWQQVILYGLIVQKSKFFVYQRAGKESEYKEKRLASKISVGIGGHIEPFDDNLMSSLYRELEEEVVFLKSGAVLELKNGKGVVDISKLSEVADIKIIGLIKDESDAVGRVHIGLICKVEIGPATEVRIRQGENLHGQMFTLEECEALLALGNAEAEGWTKLTIELLRQSQILS